MGAELVKAKSKEGGWLLAMACLSAAAAAAHLFCQAEHQVGIAPGRRHALQECFSTHVAPAATLHLCAIQQGRCEVVSIGGESRLTAVNTPTQS